MMIPSDVKRDYESLNFLQKGVVNLVTFFYKYITHDENLAFTKLVRFFRPFQKGDNPVADKADQVRQDALPSTQNPLWITKCESTGIKPNGNLRQNIAMALGKENIHNQCVLIERLLKDDILSDSEFVGFFLKIKEDGDIWDLFSTLPLNYSDEELRVYVRQQILKIPVTAPKTEQVERAQTIVSATPQFDSDKIQMTRIIRYIKNHFKDKTPSQAFSNAIEMTLNSYIQNGKYNLAVAFINEFDFVTDLKAYEFNHNLKQLKQKALHQVGRDVKDISLQFDKVEQDIINKMKDQSAIDIFIPIKSISNTLLQRRLAQKFYDSYKKEGDEIKMALFFYESEKEHNLIPIQR